MPFGAPSRLKEELSINVELASPADFIPELPGREGYGFYARALAKIERGHTTDLEDVEPVIQRGQVDPRRLRELFDVIEPDLQRYPAIDPPTFRRMVETVAARHSA